MDAENKFFEMAEEALRQSWEVHRQAFGPILEPAFVDNPQARIVLINALNHISRREIKEGMARLKEISPCCSCDEDRAAWAFCVGLGFEMAGGGKEMVQWYTEAGKYGHRFFLPYLKLAKAAHQAGQFEAGKTYYRQGIQCLLEAAEPERTALFLGSAYTNLASCCTMLHQYEEAQQAWAAAQTYPQQPGAGATGAILCAAMGQAREAEAYLAALEQVQPQLAGPVRTMVEQILAGEHPQFPAEP